jgi:hypothetical protein
VQIAAFAPPAGRHVPLLEQTAAILSTHLSGLHRVAAPEVNFQPLTNTIAAGQQQRQQEQAVARLDKDPKEQTWVESWLGVENFARLLRYCRVKTEADLAPLWSTLAKAPSKDRLTILHLRAFLGLYARAFPASLPYPWSQRRQARPSAVSPPLPVSQRIDHQPPHRPSAVSTRGTTNGSRVNNEAFNNGLFGVYKTSALKAKGYSGQSEGWHNPSPPCVQTRWHQAHVSC